MSDTTSTTEINDLTAAERKALLENRKPDGWFSRRHQTDLQHRMAQTHHATKADRQAEAADRARDYAQLSPEEKLVGLGDYRAKKERAKLERQLNDPARQLLKEIFSEPTPDDAA